jgi:hypothetical protein
MRALAAAALLASAGPALGAEPFPRPASDSVVADPSPDRRAVIEEMRKRRIIPIDRSDYSPMDLAQLRQIREAQGRGAIGRLRLQYGSVKGFTADAGDHSLLLTVQGLQAWLFVKSQDARKFLESHGAQAKDVFQIRDMQGKPLFDSRGMLTPEGDALYLGGLRKNPVFWRLPDGRTGGNVRPSSPGADGDEPGKGPFK